MTKRAPLDPAALAAADPCTTAREVAYRNGAHALADQSGNGTGSVQNWCCSATVGSSPKYAIAPTPMHR